MLLPQIMLTTLLPPSLGIRVHFVTQIVPMHSNGKENLQYELKYKFHMSRLRLT